MECPEAAWPAIWGGADSIAFPRRLRGRHTDPARDIIGGERSSDAKVCVPRVRFFHSQSVSQFAS